jgi:hypothetical protein
MCFSHSLYVFLSLYLPEVSGLVCLYVYLCVGSNGGLNTRSYRCQEIFECCQKCEFHPVEKVAEFFSQEGKMKEAYEWLNVFWGTFGCKGNLPNLDVAEEARCKVLRLYVGAFWAHNAHMGRDRKRVPSMRRFRPPTGTWVSLEFRKTQNNQHMGAVSFRTGSMRWYFGVLRNCRLFHALVQAPNRHMGRCPLSSPSMRTLCGHFGLFSPGRADSHGPALAPNRHMNIPMRRLWPSTGT